jgi:predicted Zn-dependent protease
VDELFEIAARFRSRVAPPGHWSLRLVEESVERLCVRRDVVEPPLLTRSLGAMLSVFEGGGVGYAATGDTSPAGLRQALERARRWAGVAARLGLGLAPPASHHAGSYRTPVATPWSAWSMEEKLGLLADACRRLDRDPRIVERAAFLEHGETRVLLTTANGGELAQQLTFLTPGLVAVANQGAETQSRSFGGWLAARQGCLEQAQRLGLREAPERVAEEALELLAAPNCPSGSTDLLLTPSQMILQLHESVGHPLELDRILGDERNFAGGSFVTPDMFGRYHYGSELLNVTFDPGIPEELASYGWDDEGSPATRQHLIRAGLLLRPLGGALSQARSGLPGVACARACGWNRPPIDRMANLNLEPGSSSLGQLVGSIERGVLMDTNRSWSIDDSRNKFQFGCERGRLIRDGELGPVVRNPGYRGVCAEFWHSLAGVGDTSTFQVLGVSTCGKGEPNQLIRVGHATPACVFRNVQVFGGA